LNLEGWGLRWKVTAVVAIPITVATVLGGLRVEEDLSRAIDYSAVADRASTVPDIVTLSTNYALFAAGYAASTLKDSDFTDFEQWTDAAHRAADNPALPADLADLVRSSLTTIEGFIADVKAGTVGRRDVPAESAKVTQDLAHVVDAIVSPIDDPAVIVAYRQLLDLGSAQKSLAGQIAGMMTHLMNTSIPPYDLVAASGAELATVDSMIRSYPDEADVLERIRASGQSRLDLVKSAKPNQMPQFELRDLMMQSVNDYTQLVGQTSQTIADTVVVRADETKASAIRGAIVVLVTLLATILLGVLVARSLIRPIRRLRRGTLEVANADLPDAIERIKDGDDAAVTDFEPIPVYTTEEIGQLARAVDDMHGQALLLAGEQAQLRLQIGDMFETLARRSKSLVDQQLGLIENLEFEEKDPKRLESLFRLDHLAARMRRNGDNLLILSGNRVRRAQSAPVQVGDLVRAAMSEVEDYQRVYLGSTPHAALSGAVAADVAHLFAELLDNALRASPPESRVNITFARAVDGGVLIEIVDSGIGIPAERFAEVNERLASGGAVGPETARHMGLFVVGRLAERHGLTVRLRRTYENQTNQGVTASVHIPDTLLVAPLEMPSTGQVPRVDTGGLPQVNVVHSGAIPQLVIDPVRQEPTPAVQPYVGVSERTPGAMDLPQRSSGSMDVPQRSMGAMDVPQRSLGSMDPPRRTPGAMNLPQRTPGATSLPQRTPGAVLPQRMPGVDAPAPVPADPTPLAADPVPVQADPAPMSTPVEPVEDSPRIRRHRYLANAAKTASFFQARSNVGASQEMPTAPTPIFADMVTDWLTDPTEMDEIGKFEWASPADAGWTAAQRAGQAPVESRTESGLPQRSPGHRLIPGTVDLGDRTAGRRRLRDPEAVRENLSRHQKGTRDGRAASSTDHASIGGDR